MEVIGGPRVIKVMDNCGEEKGEYLEVREGLLEAGLGDEPVRGLEDVAGVEVVVVRVPAPGVSNLKVVQEALQQGGGDLEPQQTPMGLQDLVTCIHST